LILARELPCVSVSNVLSDDKKQQVIALGRLGWSLRRIEAAVHIRRETVAGYLRAVGIPVRPPGGWGRLDAAKPAMEVITDFGAELPPITVPEPKPIVHSSARFPLPTAKPSSRDSQKAAMPWRSGRTGIGKDPGEIVTLVLIFGVQKTVVL
jgi:hypothetical protein